MLYFSVADPVANSCLLQSYHLSLYGSALGSSHALPFIQSRSLSTTHSDASGIFHTISTPDVNVILSQTAPFCNLPSPALL